MELTNAQLKDSAPSIFAAKPWEGVSSRYAFIPTIKIIDLLRSFGFVPVAASQSLTRIEGKRPFTKHLIRFQSEKDSKRSKVVDGNAHYFYKKGEAPEIAEVVMSNAHDLSAAYRIEGGIFRIVCSNGLVIRSSDFGSISVRHSGDILADVMAATKSIASQMPKFMQRIAEWRKMEMTEKQRLTMAEATLIHRYGMDEAERLLSPVVPASLLEVRRPEDKGSDLWSTTNVIQENIMRGELPGRALSGRKTKTRAITSVNATLSINRSIWAIAEVMAERIAA